MHVWGKPKFHTHTECGLKFLPLYHTSCMRGYDSILLNKDVFWVHYCLVRRPIAAPTLDCVLLKVNNLVFCSQTGAEMSFRACLWVLLPHCQMLIIHPAFYLLFNVLYRDPPRMSQVWQISEQNSPLQACWRFYFLTPQHVQELNTVPLCVG